MSQRALTVAALAVVVLFLTSAAWSAADAATSRGTNDSLSAIPYGNLEGPADISWTEEADQEDSEPPSAAWQFRAVSRSGTVHPISTERTSPDRSDRPPRLDRIG